ncbi:DUF4123 domain-containing protein [Spartinivicinus poritis]|uniref:DUF4123 domain-containing protein n=1 Tax=Spartinivicinus poritis TaxID=2994640 RepID=A0ABT5UDA7_9GAMM|nr:DUF4123 domain-containing protein [Spartinivicinus sp. A2-2]MDE1463438.1 DUF4123 domain-containing protein [Spartinivicinus sp. A2-2]
MTVLYKQWPKLPCYLLLDAGKHPVINNWINDSYNSYAIYLNTPYAALKSLSPQLVECSFDAKLWSVFQRQGIYNQWGILLFSNADFSEIVRHCQWWIQVQTENKMTGIFRLYDPHLCYKLFTCSSDIQRQKLLGIINSVCCFHDGWHQFDNAVMQPVDYQYMLSLDSHQWRAIKEDKSTALKKRIHQHVQHLFPHLLRKKDAEQQQQWVNMLLDEASALHFTTAQDIYQFINIIGILGMDALNPKVYPEIYQLLTDQDDGSPAVRLREATMLAQQAVKQVVIE